MINHLVVNPEVYILTFATSDNMHFDLIRNCIKNVVPNSKRKEVFNNNQDNLYVHKEYYEQVIDAGLEFLKNNNIVEDHIYWANVNGILFPCGYYQVAVATPSIPKKDKTNRKICEVNIKDYCKNIGDNLKTKVYLSYDYLTDTYGIALKGINYSDLLLNFNSFVFENGIGPFEKIEAVSCYGVLEQRKYPILAKRK